MYDALFVSVLVLFLSAQPSINRFHCVSVYTSFLFIEYISDQLFVRKVSKNYILTFFTSGAVWVVYSAICQQVLNLLSNVLSVSSALHRLFPTYRTL